MNSKRKILIISLVVVLGVVVLLIVNHALRTEETAVEKNVRIIMESTGFSENSAGNFADKLEKYDIGEIKEISIKSVGKERDDLDIWIVDDANDKYYILASSEGMIYFICENDKNGKILFGLIL